MKKKSNFRVEVMPDCGWKEEPTEGMTNRLYQDIQRHCDIGNATVLWDYVCEFCGDDYDNCLDERGCPICCDKAMKEWEEQNKTITPTHK